MVQRWKSAKTTHVTHSHTKKRILPNKNPKELNQQLQLQKTQKLLAWKEILKSKNKD
jgi:hypothetical protein